MGFARPSWLTFFCSWSIFAKSSSGFGLFSTFEPFCAIQLLCSDVFAVKPSFPGFFGGCDDIIWITPLPSTPIDIRGYAFDSFLVSLDISFFSSIFGFCSFPLDSAFFWSSTPSNNSTILASLSAAIVSFFSFSWFWTISVAQPCIMVWITCPTLIVSLGFSLVLAPFCWGSPSRSSFVCGCKGLSSSGPGSGSPSLCSCVVRSTIGVSPFGVIPFCPVTMVSSFFSTLSASPEFPLVSAPFCWGSSSRSSAVNGSKGLSSSGLGSATPLFCSGVDGLTIGVTTSGWFSSSVGLFPETSLFCSGVDGVTIGVTTSGWFPSSVGLFPETPLFGSGVDGQSIGVIPSGIIPFR